MYPILFQSGHITLYAYGFFLMVAFVAAAGITLFRARKAHLGISFEAAAELFFYNVLAALIGARLFHALLNFDSFRSDPLRFFRIWEGGLVFYGGFLLAAAVSAAYMARHRLPSWKILDLVSPPLALGLGIGRIGCFLAGCCYGEETGLPWGVVFTDPASLARLNVPLHPTQLYEALGAWGIFFFLGRLDKRKRFDGQTFAALLILYSTIRFLIEIVRGDPRGFLFQRLSTSQGVGILLIIFSFFVLMYLKRKHGRQVRWQC
jgi:phosphatidylglycerol---prolipoprotein diacylglyceryl transferase